jgi:hypothetical protein
MANATAIMMNTGSTKPVISADRIEVYGLASAAGTADIVKVITMFGPRKGSIDPAGIEPSLAEHRSGRAKCGQSDGNREPWAVGGAPWIVQRAVDRAGRTERQAIRC